MFYLLIYVLNYFGMASMNGKLKTLDGWLHNRLRYCIWHDWKKARSAPGVPIAIGKL
jgi:hypothetical protein